MKILLPTSMPLSPDLPAGVGSAAYDVAAAVPEEHHDAEALVTWGNPTAQMRQAAADLTRLRWVQSLAAGVDQVLEAGFPAEVLVTSGRSLHDRPVAEHTLALMLAAARRLDLAVLAQRQRRWDDDLGGLQPVDNGDRLRTLRDAHVVIWGFGSIAAALAPLLRALGARVTGIARSSGERHGFPVVSRDELGRVLPTADVLVLILPAEPQTRDAVDAAVLALLRPSTWVVNVGRGTTVDEAALVAALTDGRIGGAALDVTAVEPLPADSPLWDAPNLVLTPHAAGGRPLGADALIAENLRALLEGRPLRNVVPRL